jgi:RimJ/RimL family protein N-acetyltransferase
MSNVPLPATVLYVPRYPMETERLKLRPFNRGDVDAVFAYRSLPAVARYLFDDPMSH